MNQREEVSENRPVISIMPVDITAGPISQYGVQQSVDAILGSKTKISFEDFRDFACLRGNFRGYFSSIGNPLFDNSFRKRGFYLRFSEKHNELTKQLIRIYDRPDLVFYTLNDEEMRLLYMAYGLMLEDDEVITNYDVIR